MSAARHQHGGTLHLVAPEKGLGEARIPRPLHGDHRAELVSWNQLAVADEHLLDPRGLLLRRQRSSEPETRVAFGPGRVTRAAPRQARGEHRKPGPQGRLEERTVECEGRPARFLPANARGERIRVAQPFRQEGVDLRLERAVEHLEDDGGRTGTGGQPIDEACLEPVVLGIVVDLPEQQETCRSRAPIEGRGVDRGAPARPDAADERMPVVEGSPEQTQPNGPASRQGGEERAGEGVNSHRRRLVRSLKPVKWLGRGRCAPFVPFAPR